jgi:hypothetical protein
MSEDKKSEDSKVWLIADYPDAYGSDDAPQARVSEPVKVLIESYQSNKAITNDYRVPVGIVYEHDNFMESLHAIPLLSYTEVNSILGKILTFVDATYTDKEQREATKKILRTTIWEYNNYLQDRLKRSVKNAKVEKSFN